MIQLENIVYAAGSFRLELSLTVGTGSYFVLLGPTGAGKTACVECLAGLRDVASGRIVINGRDVTGDAPRRRAIGYVPQDYALFTHRTVRGNIAFGPEVQRWPRAEIAAAVAQVSAMIGIGDLLDRRIAGMSGGERQRVALARALAARPEVLILDEPVSALDEFTRERICGELRSLQQRLRLTTIHVCHSIEEALSVADAAAVIRDGRIEQTGPMEDLMRRPRTEFVARFMRCENILAGQAVGPGPDVGTTLVNADDVFFTVPGNHAGRVAFVIRPENWTLAGASQPHGGAVANVIPVKVARAVDRGAYVRLDLEGRRSLVAHVPRAALQAVGGVGATAVASVRSADIHVLPAS